MIPPQLRFQAPGSPVEWPFLLAVWTCEWASRLFGMVDLWKGCGEDSIEAVPAVLADLEEDMRHPERHNDQTRGWPIRHYGSRLSKELYDKYLRGPWQRDQRGQPVATEFAAVVGCLMQSTPGLAVA